MTPAIEYRQVVDSREAAKAALAFLLQQSAAAIVERGRFIFAMSGGRTPKLLYQMLATTDQDWSRWLQGADLPIARVHGRNQTVLITDIATPP